MNWGRADFLVKHVAEGQVATEAQALNRGFRRSGDAGFPPAGKDAPLEASWHAINGVAATWVQLEPDREARTWMIENHKYNDVEDLDAPRWESYPPEWHPLLDIPDEAEGVHTLDRGVDDVAADSATLRMRMLRVSQGATAVLGLDAR